MNKALYSNLVFDLSRKGCTGYSLPHYDYGKAAGELPENLRRQTPPSLPEIDEPSAVRHYTNSSNNNFGVDTGFYPLGSCTMKYNPKVNEAAVAMAGIAPLHPLQPVETAQGALRVYRTLEKALSEIGGMAEFTLNPFAGAHGEYTGLMVIRRYHMARGDEARRRVIVPDSAHGTNPASAAMAGFDIVEVKSMPDGTVDIADLGSKLDETIAAVMMTNPNTVGMFEKGIPEIAEMVHKAGALLYYDGANLNPMLGIARPGDMGFDVMHINLHKTFSTPHGGGGPGAGPVGVRAGLEEYLPNPRVSELPDGTLAIDFGADAFGRVGAWLGNFTVYIKALAYILSLGSENLMRVGPLATLNANYIMHSLSDLYEQPIAGPCKHEFVFDGLRDKSTGVTTLHVAKALLDYGFHAPTIYFPLLFHESLMIEPTETESRPTLDAFIATMRKIALEASAEPDTVKNAPYTTPISHPDEDEAALNPVVTYRQLCAKQI